MKSDSYESASPRIVRSGLIDYSQKDGCIQFRSKYLYGTNSLNETASFIFKKILDNPSINIKTLIEDVCVEYNVDDYEKIKKDVDSILNKWWKIGLITWHTTNPYETAIKFDQFEIIKITHDHVNELFKSIKKSCHSIYFDTDNLSKEALRFNLIYNLVEGYAIRIDGKITSYVLFADGLNFPEIIALNVGTKYDELYEYTHKTIKSIALMYTYPDDVQTNMICREIGLTLIGTSHDESKKGDVNYYCMGASNGKS